MVLRRRRRQPGISRTTTGDCVARRAEPPPPRGREGPALEPTSRRGTGLNRSGRASLIRLAGRPHRPDHLIGAALHHGARFAVVGLDGQSSGCPRHHAALQIQRLESRAREHGGRPRRSSSRAADDDHRLVLWQLAEVVIELAERDVASRGSVTSAPLSRLANVEQQRAGTRETFRWSGPRCADTCPTTFSDAAPQVFCGPRSGATRTHVLGGPVPFDKARSSTSQKKLDPNWTPKSRCLGLRERQIKLICSCFHRSGRQDLNLRPPGPQPGALPDCATPRDSCKRATGIEPALEAWKASVQPQHFARKPCAQDSPMGRL